MNVHASGEAYLGLSAQAVGSHKVIVSLRNALRPWCGAQMPGWSCGSANMGSRAGFGRRDLCASAPVKGLFAASLVARLVSSARWEPMQGIAG